MNAIVATLVVFSLSPAHELPTAVWQLVPAVDGEMVAPKVTKERAVLCIPGLYPHPLRPEKATKPEVHPWFAPKAALLKALEADFDVYAFGYAQTTSIDLVASSNGLANIVEQLRKAQYKEIVLIGHSAGGLVAVQFAERFPKSGVTKVIPVSAPFTGSELADLNLPLPRTQVAYIGSLAPEPRKAALALAKEFPREIEICCVLCKFPRLSNDIMVNLESQWPEEIRKQGIPAVLVAVNHFEAIIAAQGVTAVTDLAKAKLIRWDAIDVAKATEIIYSKDADAVAMPGPKRPLLKRIGGLIDRK